MAPITTYDAVQGDSAAFPTDKGVLQGVGNQLFDNKACGHRDVDRNRVSINLQVEANPLRGMGALIRTAAIWLR